MSCQSGFTLMGDVCLSSFNYQVSVVFAVTLADFANNYLGFMNQLASAAGVGINNIVIMSITQGSVSVNAAITSFNAPGSTQAVADQNNLNNLINSGTVNNMPVSSAALTTAGGSNDNSSSGLSTTTIILLAVLIPVGVLCTFLFI